MNTKALGISTIVSIWFVVTITIIGERVKPFKDFLASLTGHHWVTKGAGAFVLYILLYALLARLVHDSDDTKPIYGAVLSAVTGGLVLFLFFLLHFLL